MRKCLKGTPCGNTCIRKSAKCRSDLSQKLSGKVTEVSEGLNAGDIFRRALVSTGTEKTPDPDNGWSAFRNQLGIQDDGDDPIDVVSAREYSQEFDEYFVPKRKFGDTVDWSKSFGPGSDLLGEGGYGIVMLAKPPPPVVVKRGDISENEVQILAKLSGKGISPKLIAAERGDEDPSEKGVFEGRVAMSRINGETASSYSDYQSKVGNTTVGDAYWSLRRKLHVSGVAHNDAHEQNVIIDSKGNARFVDFGLSQDNWKAALSESIGILRSSRLLPPSSELEKPVILKDSGDWQATKYSQFVGNSSGGLPPKGSNLEIIYSNRNAVYSRLRKLGLSNSEITQMVLTPIRSPVQRFDEGPWKKINDKVAEELIGIFYAGVK
jgi:hypothetical protein